MPASSSTFFVHEKFVNGNPKEVSQCLDEFLGGEYEIVNPMEERYVQASKSDFRQEGYAWFMWAGRGKKRWLLEHHYCSEPFLEWKSEGFMNWLKQFNPKNCNDWLLAPRLYSNSLFFGNPDWSRIAATQTKTVKRVLSPSRGLLVWNTQYRHLIHIAVKDATIKRVDELVSGYVRRKDATLTELESMWIDGISLKELFDEHQDHWLGIPNPYVSGLLSEFLTI